MKLGKVSIIVQTLVKLLIIFVIFYYIFILILFPVGKKLATILIPPKDPPNPIYGALDPVDMIGKTILNSNPTYVLNTKDGKLPTTLPNKMNVYRLKTPQFSYESGKDAQNDAAVLGFTDSNLISDLKGDVYKWLNKATESYLEISIQDKELIAATQFLNKESFFKPGTIATVEAVNVAKTVLSKINRFSDDAYKSGTQNVYLGRFTPSGLVETKNPAEAQLARVDFFRYVGRNPVTKRGYPILGPDAKKGLIQMYVRHPETENATLNVAKADIFFKETETKTDASYPIIAVDTAWNNVSAGKGVISSVRPKDANPFTDYKPVRVDKILINDIYLAYYELPHWHKYLTPIYVFEGNYTTAGGGTGSITLYYPALTQEYVKQPETIPPTTK